MRNSNKIQEQSKQNQNKVKEQNINKSKPINNSPISYINKNQNVINTSINNKKIEKNYKNQIEIKQKIINNVKPTNNSENVNSITKRNSIKNYLMLNKSKFLEEDKNEIEDNPKLKITNNINHSRIKNYLRNKNIDETDKTIEEKGKVNNNLNNNKDSKIIRQSKSSYDLFKKPPMAKK